MYLIIQYIKFLLKSTNQHGVHSPFVYDLVTKCFYDKTEYPEYYKMAGYRSSLLRNQELISIKDLGPGSRKTKTNQRQICEIARTSGTSIKRTKLLFRLTKYFKPKNILELGTSLGISTHALGTGNPEANITTIEGCPNLQQHAQHSLKSTLDNNINCINSNFDTILSELTSEKYDLVFFDGNHQKEATLNYFESLLPTTHNDSVFIFDDIHWSKGMTQAWDTIKKHPKVTITIDSFYWGFVFFRKEQAKEHFVVRI